LKLLAEFKLNAGEIKAVMHISKYNIYFPFEEKNKNVIINPYHGKYLVVSNDTYRALLSNNIAGLAEYQPLKENKLINDEAEVVVDHPDQNSVHDFFIFVTMACNLNCIYCFQHKNQDYSTTGSLLTFAQIDRIFEFIEKTTGQNYTPNVYIFGGEPLLNDKTFRLISYINEKSNGIKTDLAVITNGFNLKRYHKKLAELENIKHIQVTVDGPKDLHDQRRMRPNGAGSFENIIEGINSLIDSPLNLSVRINIDSQNIMALEMLAEYFHEIGWDSPRNLTIFCGPYRDLLCYNYQYQLAEDEALDVILSLYQKSERAHLIKLLAWPGIDYISELVATNDYPSLRDKFCIANHGRWAFTPDNLLYPCGTAGGNKTCAIGEYYPNMKINDHELKKWRRRSTFRISKCRKCSLSLICGGGCALQASIKNGDIRRPFCPNIYNNINVYLKHFLEYLN
jgi:uncharacterized protein